MHELNLDGMDFEAYSKSVANNVNSQQLSLSEFDKIIKESRNVNTY